MVPTNAVPFSGSGDQPEEWNQEERAGRYGYAAHRRAHRRFFMPVIMGMPACIPDRSP
jgi:hypothetical protein